MRRGMMGILACPVDKHAPLELFECGAGGGGPVETGAIYCPRCSRFYPIVGGIPVMLPDELRDREEDIAFLRDNRGSLPAKVYGEAAPWHL